MKDTFEISTYSDKAEFDQVCDEIQNALRLKFFLLFIISPIYAIGCLVLFLYLMYILHLNSGLLLYIILFVTLLIGFFIKQKITSSCITPRVERFKDFFVRKALETKTDLQLYCHRENDFCYNAHSFLSFAAYFGLPSALDSQMIYTVNDYFYVKRNQFDVHAINIRANANEKNTPMYFDGFSFIIELPQKVSEEYLIIIPKPWFQSDSVTSDYNNCDIFKSPEFKNIFQIERRIITQHCSKEDLDGNTTTNVFEKCISNIRFWEKQMGSFYGFVDTNSLLTDYADDHKSLVDTSQTFDTSSFLSRKFGQILVALYRTHKYVSVAIEGNILVLSVGLKKDQFEPRYKYSFMKSSEIMSCVSAEVDETLSLVDPMLKHLANVFTFNHG